MAIEQVTDKFGRRFRTGKPFAYMAGVKVAEITRTGCFVTVRFGPTVERPTVPEPVVLHTDDLAAVEEVAEGKETPGTSPGGTR